MAERRVRVAITIGLRARALELFVKRAARSPSPVGIARPEADHATDATSYLSVLGLGIDSGDEIVITADDRNTVDDLADLASTEEL